MPTKPLARGATQKMLVAPEKAKAKAEAKVRARAKARVKDKAKEKAKAKRVAKRAVKKEDDLGLARPAAEHPLLRGTAHLRVDDRLPRIQRKCVSCTQKGNVQKATQIAHSYTIRHANGTRRADVEMEPNAYSRTEKREECLLYSRHRRSSLKLKNRRQKKLRRTMAKPKPKPRPRPRLRRVLSDKRVRGVILAHPTVLRTAASPKLRHRNMK